MAAENETFDREPSLLMYAAGEMTPQQRAEFERRLSADAELAGELAAWRAAQERAETALADLDQHDRPPVSDAVAIRRAARAMQQWQMKRAAARQKVVVMTRGLPLPWWMYPTAAAAALVVGFLVWSSRQEVGPVIADDQTRRNIEFAQAEAEALAEELDTWFEPVEFADSATPRTYDVGAFFLMPYEETSQ